MAQNFTDAVTNALQTAFTEAQKRRNTEVTENHLLLAFLEDPEGYFTSILTNLGTNPETLIQEVDQSLRRSPTFSGTAAQPPGTARNLQSRIADAENIAQKWNDTYTSSDHFLISYWKNGGEPFSSWKQSTEYPSNN